MSVACEQALGSLRSLIYFHAFSPLRSLFTGYHKRRPRKSAVSFQQHVLKPGTPERRKAGTPECRNT